MPVKRLPPHPDLTHLKRQARSLVQGHTLRQAAAAQRLREFHPRFAQATDEVIFNAALKLADAQLTIARERGFPSWPRLREQVLHPSAANNLDLPHQERITDGPFRRALALVDAGDAEGLRRYLDKHPGLTRRQVTFEVEITSARRRCSPSSPRTRCGMAGCLRLC